MCDWGPSSSFTIQSGSSRFTGTDFHGSSDSIIGPLCTRSSRDSACIRYSELMQAQFFHSTGFCSDRK